MKSWVERRVEQMERDFQATHPEGTKLSMVRRYVASRQPPVVGNALDAVQDQPVRQLWLEASHREGQVLIHVRDSGPGLGDEALTRLFEPFFTTKAQGVGLGLGLAISRDIAREGGGELEARNHAQGGAEFVLRLPGVDAGAAQA